MIESETSYITYEVRFRMKNGKGLRRAYIGNIKEMYDQTIRDLETRENIKWIDKTISETTVTLYD